MFTLGQCDILFINPPHHRRRDSGVNIPLGLGYLASYVRSNGFTPAIIDCAPIFSETDPVSLEKMKKFLEERLSETYPSLAVGIGPCTLACVRSLVAIGQVCKKKLSNVPTIYGGPLASISELEWFFFDNLGAYAVVPGDAEVVLLKLLEHLKSGNRDRVEGVSYGAATPLSPNRIRNLDDLPFPARDLFDKTKYFPSIRRDLFVYPYACMVCTRGCIHECIFCSSSSVHNGSKSNRSLSNVSEEVRMLTKEMAVKSIIFYDDCLFSNESSVNEEVREFARIVKTSGNGVLWQVEMRTNIASLLDETSIGVLYSSGCRQINMGIEKGTKKGLKSIGKGTKPEQAVEACLRIRQHSPKMRLAGTFILGGPGETYDDVMETIEFAKKLGLLFAHFYPLEMYPGTKLYTALFGKENRVWLDLVNEDSVFDGSLIYEDILKKKDLLELSCQAYREFYRRNDWVNLAKRQLGKESESVSKIAFSWGESSRW